MAAPEPGVEDELRQLIYAELDAMVLAGQLMPDYEVRDLTWNPESSSYTATLRMNLVLPLTGPG